MKNMVIGISAAVFLGLLVLIAYTLHGRSVRQSELDLALSVAMKESLKGLEELEAGQARSTEEFVEEFLQRFSVQIASKSKVTVHILDVDVEKGLLSVEAISSFRHPIGSLGSVSRRRTAILEQYQSQEQPEYCCITYLVEGERYKSYYVQKGSGIRIPGKPKVEGKEFAGWREAGGDAVLSLAGTIVTEDCTYVASFREQ